jgi:hypothetical protein
LFLIYKLLFMTRRHKFPFTICFPSFSRISIESSHQIIK